MASSLFSIVVVIRSPDPFDTIFLYLRLNLQNYQNSCISNFSFHRSIIYMHKTLFVLYNLCAQVLPSDIVSDLCIKGCMETCLTRPCFLIQGGGGGGGGGQCHPCRLRLRKHCELLMSSPFKVTLNNVYMSSLAHHNILIQKYLFNFLTIVQTYTIYIKYYVKWLLLL